MKARPGLLAPLVILALGAEAFAQCEAKKLVASDAGATGAFGWSVCVQDSRALVGAVNSKSGVYVLERGVGGWSEVQRLEPVGVTDLDYGYSVALDGDRAAVGALLYPGTTSSWGAVYVYERVGGAWIEEALLLSDQPGYQKNFGVSVSLSGDRLAVGESGPYPHPGAFHVFDRVAGVWTRSAKVTTPGAHNYLGRSISLDGDRVAVGSFGLDVQHTYEGAVHIVERDALGTWIVTQTLNSSQPTDHGWFGYSVALQGDRLVVSAPGEAGRTNGTGALYVFERSGGTWLETARITTPDGESGDRLGERVALDGERLAAGAQYDAVGTFHSGSVYVFERLTNGWSLALKKSAPVPAVDQHFGWSVGLSGSTLLAGAYLDAEAGIYAGAVHAYTLDSSVVNYCQTAPNSAGDGARISSAGSTSITQNDFHLAADGAPPNKFGKFFYGPQTKNVPFGNGHLCIGGQLFRLEATPASSTGNGFDWLDFTVPPAGSGAGTIHPGSTWHFQYWYRDPAAGGATFNLSDALAVTFCQ